MPAALPFVEEAVERFRELGDEHFTMIATTGFAWVVEELGDVERAKRLHEENLLQARARGNRRLEAYSLAQLAFFGRKEGRLDDAALMLKQSIRLIHDVGDRLELAIDLGRFAAVLANLGRADAAVLLVSSSEALIEQLGAGTPWWAARGHEETLTIARSQLDDAAFTDAWEQGAALSFDEAVALALDDGAQRTGLDPNDET